MKTPMTNQTRRSTFEYACLLVAFLSITACSASAVEEVKLEPNEILKFEFPDLPATYHSKRTGHKQPAMLSARLPENYSRDGKFPLLLFLGGGTGGPGDAAADIRGTEPRDRRDYIAVNLPLFIKDVNGPPTVPPRLQAMGVDPDTLKGMIMFDDFEVLSAAYRVMLQKLLDAVPNISRKGSMIGGFSNGAHAVSVLLAGKDEFIMSHFESFVIWEGGIGLVTNPLGPEDVPALRNHRFLFLMGDQPGSAAAEESAKRWLEALVQGMKKQKIDCSLVVMVGYGHAMPKEYGKLVGNWVRGEPLPAIPPKSPQP